MKHTTKTALGIIIILWLCAMALPGQGSPGVRIDWEPPAYGSPVVFYEVEVYQEGELVEEWTQVYEPWLELPAGLIQPLYSYTARVRGTDMMGRWGPWSEVSDAYVHDPGPPGSCQNVRIASRKKIPLDSR